MDIFVDFTSRANSFTALQTNGIYNCSEDFNGSKLGPTKLIIGI